jgi:phospholipid-binding lipoprotein MlaA
MKKTAVLTLVLLVAATALAGEPGPNSALLSNAGDPLLRTEAHPLWIAAEKTPSEKDPFADEDLDFLEEETQEAPAITVADPLYGWNKLWFEFNDQVYLGFIDPMLRLYVLIVPEFARKGARNFFYNLAFPVRFVNCLLQGKGNRAGEEYGRFVTNTVLGVGGLFNPAKNIYNIDPPAEDFGQTMGHWGLGNGFYLVWPLLGPSTLRDTGGMVGDHFLDPKTYLLRDQSSTVRYSISGYEVFNNLSFRIGDYQTLKEAAIDPYQALRDGYIQNRHNKVLE